MSKITNDGLTQPDVL